jgi:hypothetical protein
MNRFLILATAAFCTTLLGACASGGDAGTSTSAFQHISIAHNGDVIAHAHDGSTARISASGDLDIRGRSVAVTPSQRDLLRGYHAAALALRNDAIATGTAGVETGMHALDAVAKGLASGNPDSIDADITPRANKVDALAQTVCRDLEHLYAEQTAVAAALQAFAPYATIEQREVSGCPAKHIVINRP